MLLRVLTYNIRKGKGNFRGRILLRALAEGVARRGPDILLCQEVFHSADDNGAFQSMELARELRLASIYEPNAAYQKGHHGNATFTHLRVRKTAHRDISTNRLERRGLLYSLLGDDDRLFHIVNTHLGLNRWQRRRQIESIAGFLSEYCSDGRPVVLAGDFNDWTGQLDRFVRRECGLHNALDALGRSARRSWPSHRPVFGLDRIYYRGLRLRWIGILHRAPWNQLSDHLPVEAEFEVR